MKQKSLTKLILPWRRRQMKLVSVEAIINRAIKLANDKAARVDAAKVAMQGFGAQAADALNAVGHSRRLIGDADKDDPQPA